MSNTTIHPFSHRTSTLPPCHSSSYVPLPRSRSRSSTNSSSSSASQPNSSQQHGMSRKVAASLDLFRETTSSADELDDLDKPSKPLATKRRVTSKHHSQTSAEPEFSFFTRSEWPDRETAAARREHSGGNRDRVLTRDDSYPIPASRDPSDAPRRKDRPHSVRENVISDLVNWRKDVLGDSYQDRGRSRKRSLDSNHHVDPVDHKALHRDQPSSFSHPCGFQFSSSPGSLSDALTSPIVPSAIIPDSPFSHQGVLPPSNAPNSLYTVEDEDDESSNWDDETASDSGSTASTNSPWPRSPLQSSASLSPMLKHSVHHEDHDDEGEDAGLVMSSRVRPSTVPPELSDFPSYLSNFHDDDVQPGEEAADHEPFSRSLGDLSNLSQESLPHIPLQPFRNQVGGHSAIYKFTKRAVCKVR